MQSNILIQPTYFGSILEFATIVQSNKVTFETFDNFQKQTYRSRCYIYGANGKLLLNVPVKKLKNGAKQLTVDTEISYEEDWQKLHFRSLESAYRTSPYFEFYEDDLSEVIFKKHKTLGELHKAITTFLWEALQIEIPTDNSTEYFMKPKQTDLRYLVSPKIEHKINFSTYVQMFDDKYGFIKNLSILDLLFMEGPNTTMYLENINLNSLAI